MTPQQSARLFTAFSQAEASTARRFGGTGLGLSICRSLVELMGGEIGIKSEAGRGSCFWFTTTCQPAEPPFVNDRQIDDMPLHGKRLLIVEGTPEFSHTLQAFTHKWGMTTDIAGSKHEAQRLLEQGIPAVDLVNTDMTLPDGTGLELALWMNSKEQLCRTPRLLFTTHSSAPTPQEADQAGLKIVLQKPASVTQIKRSMLKALGYMDERSQEEARSPAQQVFVGRHVLVAEDNGVNQMVIRSMLKKLGISTTLVGNGQEALDILHNAQPKFDLVLMDCEMPVMDGFESARAIRQLELATSCPRVPIVALTAHAMAEHQQLCFKAGMDDHLAKPIDLEQLREMLSRHFKNAEKSSGEEFDYRI